jgi:ParB family transcriptional regulator, chromosome partitioning protein
MSSVTTVSAPKSNPRRRFTVDSLFTDGRPQAIGVVDLPQAKEIRLDRIVPDPSQPRRTFDRAKMDELAASIGLEGVLQPIVVQYDETDDIYVILHGERRWRAARTVGLASIPAIVREVGAEHRLIHQLMENIVREDLNALDRAAALRSLKTQLNDAPWEDVAKTVGIRRSRLFQLLGTEKLPESIQEDIKSGRLSEKQTRALQGLPPQVQVALRDAILADSLSSDESFRFARGLKAARIQDDAAAATLKIAELRSTTASASPKADDAVTMLQAIAAAGRGGARERSELARLSAAAWAAPFDIDRLELQVQALARTLSRASSANLRPGSPAYTLLFALRNSLSAVLEQAEPGTGH